MIIFPVHKPDPAPALHHPPVRPGADVTLTTNALGFALSAPHRGASFDHPFRPALSAASVMFRLGTVQSLAGDGPLEPQISSGGDWLPMSGKNGNNPTPLDLSGAEPNENGVSWAVLNVFPDDTGELRKNDLPHIYHTRDNPVSLGALIGETALSMILWQGKTPVRVLPIVHFNLRYFRILPSVGNSTGPTKHVFL